MYKAKVQAVSGLKVLAGGKWLTCIGNKNVRTGDLIWTDGRCVYGNEQTPQQPFVITAKEVLGIPIAARQKCSTYYKSLEEYTNIDSDIRILTNDKKGNIYFSDDRNILAANKDNFGNLYYILKDSDKIKIIKNGIVVKTVETPAKSKLKEDAENAISEYGAPGLSTARTGVYKIKAYFATQPVTEESEDPDVVPFLGFEWLHLRYTQYLNNLEITTELESTVTNELDPYERFYHSFDWAFIENEENWGVVVTSDCTYEVHYPIAEYDHVTFVNALTGDGWLFHNLANCYYTGSFVYTYFINNSENKLLFSSAQHLVSTDSIDGNAPGTIDWYIANWLSLPTSESVPSTHQQYPLTCSFEEFINAKFPMQDGFYFVVNSLTSTTENEATKNYPELMNITIYTADNKPIFTGTFYTIAYIAACKINSEKFLLSTSKSKSSTDSVIGNGLYEIENETLTTLAGYPVNQCLRKTKKIKHWWKNIQTLD